MALLIQRRALGLLPRGRSGVLRAGRQLVLALLAGLLVFEAGAVSDVVSETRLKSAFLYKFTFFAEWPRKALGRKGAPIVICVIGRDGLASALEEAVLDHHARSRPIEVRRPDAAARAEGCHMAFIGWSDPKRVDRALATLAEQPILTVGDAEDFAEWGGMISLVRRGRRIRIEVNRGAVERAGLSLSSQLLKLATLVGGPDGAEE